MKTRKRKYSDYIPTEKFVTNMSAAHISLTGFLPAWRKDGTTLNINDIGIIHPDLLKYIHGEHTLRAFPRAGYMQVQTIKSGYTSELPPYDLGTYINSKGKELKVKMVDDHFLSPQTVTEFILDNPDPYLKDVELFRRLFECISYTHEITNIQNTSLAQLKHTVPTFKKYQHKNIKLYNKKTSAPVDNLLNLPVHVSDTFCEEFCQWEKEMVLNSDTEYGELLPDEKIYVQKSNCQLTNLYEFFRA